MSTSDLAIPRSGDESSWRQGIWPALAAILIYAFLVLGSYRVGTALRAAGARLGLEAPPLFGRLEPRLSLRLAPAVLVAVAIVTWGPRLAARLPWGYVLCVSFLAAGTWAVALAASDGIGAVAVPVTNPLDAFAFLDEAPPAGELLGNFTSRIDGYPIHVQSHPPGLLLLLKALLALGIAVPGVVAALYIAGGAAIVPAVLETLRSVGSEGAARLAAPWLVLAPFALWLATSADALYSGVAAWGVALMVTAGPGRPAKAVIGGVLFGFAIFLTYGAIALGIVPLTVALARRTFRPLAFWTLGVAAVAAVLGAFGFWWFDGLRATREQYYAGLGGLRPYWFFLISNFAALAIACGPATLRGALGASGPRHGRLLVGAVFLAVVAANLSGLSKGEVERIWLLFIPWLVVAASWMPVHLHRRWLAVSAATALAVQALVRTPW